MAAGSSSERRSLPGSSMPAPTRCAESSSRRDLTASLLVVAGATATGKTGLAVEVAERLTGEGIAAEVISADSRQVYRGLDIGTAKIPRRRAARHPASRPRPRRAGPAVHGRRFRRSCAARARPRSRRRPARDPRRWHGPVSPCRRARHRHRRAAVRCRGPGPARGGVPRGRPGAARRAAARGRATERRGNRHRQSSSRGSRPRDRDASPAAMPNHLRRAATTDPIAWIGLTVEPGEHRRWIEHAGTRPIRGRAHRGSSGTA